MSLSQIVLNLNQNCGKMSPTSAPSTPVILMHKVLGRRKPVIVVTGGSGYIGSHIGEEHRRNSATLHFNFIHNHEGKKKV